MNAKQTIHDLQVVNEKLEAILEKFPNDLAEEYRTVEEAQQLINDAIDSLSNEED